jgi:hypothetical protein
MVVLIHTGECAFHASVNVLLMPLEKNASSLISIASLSGLCVSEFCVSPALVFSFGLELCPDLRDLPVARLPKILIVSSNPYHILITRLIASVSLIVCETYQT